MKCPYCEKEMEQGFIQSPHEISWKKEGICCNSFFMQRLSESNYRLFG